MANLSSIIGRRKYGIKIALPGFDVRTATDTQLLFNSSFPILQTKIWASLGTLSDNMHDVNFGGEYLGKKGTLHIHRWAHNLGYPPFFLSFAWERFNPVWQYGVDEKYIYSFRENPRRTGEKVLVCPIDITRDVEYPYTSSAVPIDSNTVSKIGKYGLKTSEAGFDSEGMGQDFQGFNMRIQSQMVLAVKTMKTIAEPPVNEDDPARVVYTLPKNMNFSNTSVYGFMKFEKGISPYDFEYWTATQIGGQSAGTLFVSKEANTADIFTVKKIPVSLVAVRQPMFAPVTTESTF